MRTYSFSKSSCKLDADHDNKKNEDRSERGKYLITHSNMNGMKSRKSEI